MTRCIQRCAVDILAGMRDAAKHAGHAVLYVDGLDGCARWCCWVRRVFDDGVWLWVKGPEAGRPPWAQENHHVACCDRASPCWKATFGKDRPIFPLEDHLRCAALPLHGEPWRGPARSPRSHPRPADRVGFPPACLETPRHTRYIPYLNISPLSTEHWTPATTWSRARMLCGMLWHSTRRARAGDRRADGCLSLHGHHESGGVCLTCGVVCRRDQVYDLDSGRWAREDERAYFDPEWKIGGRITGQCPHVRRADQLLGDEVHKARMHAAMSAVGSAIADGALPEVLQAFVRSFDAEACITAGASGDDVQALAEMLSEPLFHETFCGFLLDSLRQGSPVSCAGVAVFEQIKVTFKRDAEALQEHMARELVRAHFL